MSPILMRAAVRRPPTRGDPMSHEAVDATGGITSFVGKVGLCIVYRFGAGMRGRGRRG
jgi:hypothetical protein